MSKPYRAIPLSQVQSNQTLCVTESFFSAGSNCTVDSTGACCGSRISKKSSIYSTCATTTPSVTSAKSILKQNIASVERLEQKTLQNELADAKRKIDELTKENLTLQLIQNRQEVALNKYDFEGKELPKLLESQKKELRLWQTKYEEMKKHCREIKEDLKRKEAALLKLSDRYKQYTQIQKNKNLAVGAGKLAMKVQQLQHILGEKDEDIEMLTEKLVTITRNYKERQYMERQQLQEVMEQLHQTRHELDLCQAFECIDIGDGNEPPPRIPNKSKSVAPLKEKTNNIFPDGRAKNKSVTGVQTAAAVKAAASKHKPTPTTRKVPSSKPTTVTSSSNRTTKAKVPPNPRSTVPLRNRKPSANEKTEKPAAKGLAKPAASQQKVKSKPLKRWTPIRNSSTNAVEIEKFPEVPSSHSDEFFDEAFNKPNSVLYSRMKHEILKMRQELNNEYEERGLMLYEFFFPSQSEIDNVENSKPSGQRLQPQLCESCQDLSSRDKC